MDTLLNNQFWSVTCRAGASGAYGTALPNAPFADSSISYFENRADGGYVWDVKYDLGFDGTAFTVRTRIHLTGDDAGTLPQVWEQGIERVWNDKYALSDGTNAYAIRFDVQFVEAGYQHYDLAFHSGYGRGDMLNWWGQTAWGPDYQDEIAAHEYGHMIGCFDEYAGGASYGNFTATGTMMSDLTETLRPSYMNGIDYFAEFFSGQSFDIVEVPKTQTLTGTAGTDSLFGGAVDDLLYGLAGDDQLMGLVGNDALWGGDGRDLLRGGVGNDALHGGAGADQMMGDIGRDTLWGDAGNDTLWGGAGADLFIFARGGGRDRIGDFRYAEGDRIGLTTGMTWRVGSNNGNALIDFGSGDQVTLNGVAPGQVGRDWFVFG